MKSYVLILACFVSFASFSQEDSTSSEEFIPINIEEKEAFMSTMTGEYVYLEHATTDSDQLKTTEEGVIYVDISIHIVKKGESLYTIAKKHKLTVDKLKSDNKLSSINLKIGQELKIKKKRVIMSSSPVISSEPSRIIARLPPNESPFGLTPPPTPPSTNTEVVNADPVENSDETTNLDLNESKYYTVKNGDSLYTIAKANNMSVQELKELNNLTLNKLSIGQKLLLK